MATLKKTNETKGKIKSQHIHMKNKAKTTESCSKYHYWMMVFILEQNMNIFTSVIKRYCTIYVLQLEPLVRTC